MSSLQHRRMPAVSNDTSKWSPPLRTVEQTIQLLNDPQARVNELKVCWREPQNKNELLNKRNICSLEKALKKTPSRITHLSIGWKHGGNRKALIQLLQLIVNHASLDSLQSLKSIELVLGEWIPDTILTQLLMAYGPQLENLHIQATRMKVRIAKTKDFKNVYQSVHAVQYLLQEESVAKLFADTQLIQQLKSLKSLALIDCDVLDDDVDPLVRFLWQHTGRRSANNATSTTSSQSSSASLESLSLRSNRHMSPLSWQKICQAPVSKRLDLSLCDITNNGALAIAKALCLDNRTSWRQQHHIVLEELIMCGNYQLDEIGFGALCRVCPFQTHQWNMSYCDMNDHQSLQILKELVPLLTAATPTMKETSKTAPVILQQLTLQGAKINTPDACQALETILRSNRTLTHLRLNDSKYPAPLSIDNLNFIVQGLQYNYGLQELQLDLHFTQTCQVRDEFEFYLLLNRASRSMLQMDGPFDRDAWIQAVLKARLSRRMDVLYWLVRNSVEHLF